MQNEEWGWRTWRAFGTSRALVLCACALLVYSFVVIDDTSATVTQENIKDEITHPTPRLVFMVIDAFRLSFLTAPDSPMNFTRSSIQSSSATVFDAYARMPTVTLPRITAYITGTLPSFGTVLTNLATSEIKTDNWVTRLNTNGKKVHFFGDDTWIKLLPEQFAKSEGVTSFFVSDYTEVDNNVTSHLDEELSSEHWDALILHYLGLDHIGHSLGGTSPKIRDKLVEMDDIVEKIHRELSKTSRETYMIVCGDHGMTVAGSHGGASPEETRVPVVIWKFTGEEKHLTDRSYGLNNPKRVEQIDISATIFDIFGMRLPPDSYGISIAEAFGLDYLASTKKKYEHFKKLIEEKRLSTGDVCDGKDCDFESQFMKSTLEKWFKEVQEELVGTSYQVPHAALAATVIILFLAIWASTAFIAHFPQTDFALFAVISICFASSLIEEEHEVWYFLASTVIAFRLGQSFLDWRKGKKAEIKSFLFLAFLHRVSLGFTQSTRRRWSMDQGLLPPAVFPDSYSIPIDDLNTLFGYYPLAAIVVSGILWQCVSHRHPRMIVLPFISHLLRLFGYKEWNSIFLLPYRLFASNLMLFEGNFDSCFLSLLLIIVTDSQLLLVLMIYQIGLLSSELNMSQSETIILYTSSFFYTGNSNSLSTLSLHAAFVGFTSYSPSSVGVQLFLNTFAGPIAFTFGRKSSTAIRKSFSLNFTFRISCLIASLVCLFIFQNHLFIWSVYTPKVVYDIAHLLFHFVVDLIYSRK